MDKKWSVNCKKQQLFIGFLIISIGVMMPLLIKENDFNIYGSLNKSIHTQDSGLLLEAAFKLIILNSIRAMPNYLGALIVSEAIDIKINGKSFIIFKGILIYCVICFVYRLIYIFYNIYYDFGFPAILLIGCIFALEKMNLFSISIVKKMIFVILFLLGVQWFDVIPGLEYLGMGRGDISVDIKLIGQFLDCNDRLLFFSISFIIIFLINALLFIRLIYDEHLQAVTVMNKEKVEKQLVETRIHTLELRNFVELKNVVHDLKSPLTTIQGLASLSAMMSENDKLVEYQNNIMTSVDTMNEMISEILYEQKKSRITTEQLFTYIMANISPNKYVKNVVYTNTCEDKFINVNKIRMARAIANLIENSYSYIDHDTGIIKLNVSSSENKIHITVTDNGKGIAKEKLDKIWDVGFSDKASTGLGLNFVKGVIDDHNGTIEVMSEENKYTSVIITIEEDK